MEKEAKEQNWIDKRWKSPLKELKMLKDKMWHERRIG